MQARTAFGGARISKNVGAGFVALLVLAFLLGGASGYLFKGISLPVASRTQVSVPQANAISDASTRSHRGGPQTVESQAAAEPTVSDSAASDSGLQFLP